MATLKYDIITEVGSDIASLRERLHILENAISELQASMKELSNAIGAKPSVKSVNLKQKIDLEIFEENDPFIIPQYYLDDNKKNDCWY